MPASESQEAKSYRINGFSESMESIEAFKHNRNLRQGLSALRIDRNRIEPILIEDLGTYVAYITENLKYDIKRPIYYRVHANVNYYNVPSILRSSENIEDENWLYDECLRKFPEGFRNCPNMISKLLYIQHYNGSTRLLDLAESPLTTLAFGVGYNGKFSDRSDSEAVFSTVTVFRAPERNAGEYMKHSSSSTVSVLCAPAGFGREFLYGHALMAYHADGFQSRLPDFLYFRDLIRRSVIVSVPQDNPRIRNQKGAFIVSNANELVSAKGSESHARELMDYILHVEPSSGELPLNLARLKDGRPGFEHLRNFSAFDFLFRKEEPYSLDNKYQEYRDDPFDLERLYFRGRDGRRPVFFIPPHAKNKIRQQLASIGYTYDYIYPEADTIFHGIPVEAEKGRKRLEA